jgi:antitoxin HicB
MMASSSFGSKEIKVMYRIPLVFTPQPEGGYTVTSPALPELVTEGDTLEEAQRNVQDAFAAVLEIYTEQQRALAFVEMW